MALPKEAVVFNRQCGQRALVCPALFGFVVSDARYTFLARFMRSAVGPLLIWTGQKQLAVRSRRTY